MTTLRQIERLWDAKAMQKLSQRLLCARAESFFACDGADRAPFVAALAMIRIDELGQAHHPLFTRMSRALLASQERDGGWGDSAVTALCLRALLIGGGNGPAVDAAIGFIALLQKEQGLWPAGPMRRMPQDLGVSSFVLYELGDEPRFRDAVRFGDALSCFENCADQANAQCVQLLRWASHRWHSTPFAAPAGEPMLFASLS